MLQYLLNKKKMSRLRQEKFIHIYCSLLMAIVSTNLCTNARAHHAHANARAHTDAYALARAHTDAHAHTRIHDEYD